MIARIFLGVFVTLWGLQLLGMGGIPAIVLGIFALVGGTAFIAGY